MLDTQELQVLVQLTDNMEIITGKLESAYSANNAEEFNKAKNEIMIAQKKMNEMLSK
jgi:hypothetical protein